MLSTNTNMSSLVAQRSLKASTSVLNTAIERMSTGFKINHSKDNAANYGITTDLNTKIGSYEVAQENCAMGIDMITTADENLNLISNMLIRLRDLQEQAANGTYGEQSLQAINAEVNAIINEIERVYNNAEYNGSKLFATEEVAAAANYASRAATDTGFIKKITQRNTNSMTTLASVSNGATISSGTYSISTDEELSKLATMTNNGQITGGEFVLANDIDLSAYSNWTPIGTVNDLSGDDVSKAFTGTFDGNGYVIKNLSTSSYYAAGLFGAVQKDSIIKNLGVENAEVEGNNAGAIIGIITGTTDNYDQYYVTIDNCYSTGNISSNGESNNTGAGGLVGIAVINSLILKNSWSSADIIGSSADMTWAGGLLGVCGFSCARFENSYSTGDIKGIEAGGIAGQIHDFGDIGFAIETSFTNCFSTGKITGTGSTDDIGGIVSNDIDDDKLIYLQNCTFNRDLNPTLTGGGNSSGTSITGRTTAELKAMIPTLYTYSTPAGGGGGGAGGGAGGVGNVMFQIGINADEASQINLEISFSISGINDLRMIGLDTTTDYLTLIDNFLATVTAKQTEFGAAQNRLESAQTEIATQYSNLISSRSTLRDSDIAEVSSQYIQQQILQHASATLLSTANQTPGIALQLI